MCFCLLTFVLGYQAFKMPLLKRRGKTGIVEVVTQLRYACLDKHPSHLKNSTEVKRSTFIAAIYEETANKIVCGEMINEGCF